METTAIPSERGHQWHIRFDRIVCRNCDAVRDQDDGRRCSGARKIRPQAGIRHDFVREQTRANERAR